MPPGSRHRQSNGLISEKIDDNVKSLEYWRVVCLSADKECLNVGLEMPAGAAELIFSFLCNIIPIFHFFHGSIG